MLTYNEWKSREIEKMNTYMAKHIAMCRKLKLDTKVARILLAVAIEDIHSEKMCRFFYANQEKINREYEEEIAREVVVA